MRPLSILLAEDSPVNRAIIGAYIRNTPYTLQTEEDGQAAYNCFREGRFDVVLMDLQMPVMDGYEATRMMRAWERQHALRRTPILAVSAYALTGDREKSLAAGCDRHLTKPIRRETLLDAIAAVTGDLSTPDGSKIQRNLIRFPPTN